MRRAVYAAGNNLAAAEKTKNTNAQQNVDMYTTGIELRYGQRGPLN